MLVEAASARVTGLPALLIILLILAVIVVGIITIVRFLGRKAKEKL
jgi:hypothetical protein